MNISASQRRIRITRTIGHCCCTIVILSNVSTRILSITRIVLTITTTEDTPNFISLIHMHIRLGHSSSITTTIDGSNTCYIATLNDDLCLKRCCTSRRIMNRHIRSLITATIHSLYIVCEVVVRHNSLS